MVVAAPVRELGPAQFRRPPHPPRSRSPLGPAGVPEGRLPNPLESRGMKRWRLAVVLAGLALVAILLMALTRPRGAPVQVAEVRRGDLIVPVQSDGTLEPPPGGELRAAEAAAVAEIPAREGDRVAAGAPLVRLENPELSQKALDARSEVAAPAGRPRERRSRPRRARAGREAPARSRRSRRAPACERRDLARRAETDERALRQEEDALRAARARLAGPRRSGLAPGARRTRRLDLERRVAALTVTSPVAGVVYGLPAPGRRGGRRRPGRGERRRPGEPPAAGARGPAGPAAGRARAAPHPHLRRPSAREAGKGRSPSSLRASPRSRGARSARSSGTIADPSAEAAHQRRRGSRDRDRREERHARRSARQRCSATARSVTSLSSRTAARAAARSRSGLLGLNEVEIAAASRRTTPSSCPARRRSPTASGSGPSERAPSAREARAPEPRLRAPTTDKDVQPRSFRDGGGSLQEAPRPDLADPRRPRRRHGRDHPRRHPRPDGAEVRAAADRGRRLASSSGRTTAAR